MESPNDMETETMGGPFSFPSNVPDLSSVFTDDSDDEIDNEDFDDEFDEDFEDISDEEFEDLGDEEDESEIEEANISGRDCNERLDAALDSFDDFDELDLDADTFDGDKVLTP